MGGKGYAYVPATVEGALVQYWLRGRIAGCGSIGVGTVSATPVNWSNAASMRRRLKDCIWATCFSCRLLPARRALGKVVGIMNAFAGIFDMVFVLIGTGRGVLVPVASLMMSCIRLEKRPVTI